MTILREALRRLVLAFRVFWWALRHGELPGESRRPEIPPLASGEVHPHEKYARCVWTFAKGREMVRWDGLGAAAARREHEEAARTPLVLKSVLEVEGVVRGVYERPTENTPHRR